MNRIKSHRIPVCPQGPLLFGEGQAPGPGLGEGATLPSPFAAAGCGGHLGGAQICRRLLRQIEWIVQAS